jgi:hypothetical protein
MQNLLLFRCNNGCKNASQYYVLRTSPGLFEIRIRNDLDSIDNLTHTKHLPHDKAKDWTASPHLSFGSEVYMWLQIFFNILAPELFF